jgi:hypothetical protein
MDVRLGLNVPADYQPSKTAYAADCSEARSRARRWRQVIHRSPDRLDAVVMAVAARWYASFGGTLEHEGPIAF